MYLDLKGDIMKTITVVEKDKVGLLDDITSILSKAKINIDSVNVDLVAGRALITLGLSEPVKGKKILESAGYNFEPTNALLIRLQDRPGELNKITTLLAKDGINIERLFMISKDEGIVLFSIKVDKPKQAEVLLKSYMIEK